MDYMTTQRIGKIAGSAVLGSALLLGGAGLVFAQTYNTTGTTGSTGSATVTGGSSTTSGGGSTTPGVPNTGAGGDSAGNLAVLGVSALVALGGAAYLARQRYALR